MGALVYNEMPLTPCSCNTFLARSMPTFVTFISDAPVCSSGWFASPLWHITMPF